MLSGQRSRTSTQNFALYRRATRAAAEIKNRCGVEAMMRSGLPNRASISGRGQAKSRVRKKDCSTTDQDCRNRSAEFRETKNRRCRYAAAQALGVLGEGGEILRSPRADDAPSRSRRQPAKMAANDVRSLALPQTGCNSQMFMHLPERRTSRVEILELWRRHAPNYSPCQQQLVRPVPTRSPVADRPPASKACLSDAAAIVE